MKKFIIGLTMLSAGLFADSIYIGVNHGVVLAEKSSYFNGAEDLANVVGEGGHRTEIEVGKYFQKEYSNLFMKPYLYAYKSDKDKNGEYGGGFGASIGVKNQGISYSIGGRLGFGLQNVKGDTFMTDNGATNVSYIVGSIAGNPTEATYLKNNEVIEIGLTIDIEQQITDNLSFNYGAAYLMSSYSFAYVLNNEERQATQLSGVVQDNYKLSAGLNYRF